MPSLPQGRSNHCPICRQIDAVQKVSSLIDSGTVNNSGQAISMPIFSQHPLSDSFMTGFSSQSRSHLVIRFNVPQMPKEKFHYKFFKYWGILIFGFGIWGSTWSTGGLFWLIVLGAIFTLPGALIFGFLFAQPAAGDKMENDRIIWSRKVQRLREANYCARDDIAFDERTQGSPEQFVSLIFNG